MAVRIDNSPNNNQTNVTTIGSANKTKAKGFLNVSIMLKDGTKKKIGFLMLNQGEELHEVIHANIQSKGLDAVLTKFSYDYNVPSNSVIELDL